MKKFNLLVTLLLSSAMLSSCSSGHSQSKNNQHAEKSSNTQSEHQDNKHKHNSAGEDNKESNKTHNDQDNSKAAKTNKSHLTQYNSEQIEYARVWNQLGPLKNNMNGMDELDVTKISKGTKVNPQVKNSAVYPENVVKLSAPMKAGGSITYSSNGDGTINVYKNVPYNWVDTSQSDSDKAEKATKDAISKNIQTVKIKPTDNEQIAQLASKLKYQQ
jgi:membrane-bound lytic murein transglycosylase